MNAFKLTHFGSLDLAHPKPRYAASFELNGSTIEIDLNIEGTALPLAEAEAADAFVRSLGPYAARAKAFITTELGNKSDTTVKEFLDFHIEEVPELLDPTHKLDPHAQLLAKLGLERVGLYPQDKGDGFAVLDFTFEGNHTVNGRRAITDQIIAVYFDANGTIGHLSHES